MAYATSKPTNVLKYLVALLVAILMFIRWCGVAVKTLLWCELGSLVQQQNRSHKHIENLVFFITNLPKCSCFAARPTPPPEIWELFAPSSQFFFFCTFHLTIHCCYHQHIYHEPYLIPVRLWIYSAIWERTLLTGWKLKRCSSQYQNCHFRAAAAAWCFQSKIPDLELVAWKNKMETMQAQRISRDHDVSVLCIAQYPYFENYWCYYGVMVMVPWLKMEPAVYY